MIQVCILAEVEKSEALHQMDAAACVKTAVYLHVAKTDAVSQDGWVIGHGGKDDVAEEIARILKSGKAAGVLTNDEGLACECSNAGATNIPATLDSELVMRVWKALLSRCLRASPMRRSSRAVTSGVSLRLAGRPSLETLLKGAQ